MIIDDAWHKTDYNRFVNSAKGPQGLLNLAFVEKILF